MNRPPPQEPASRVQVREELRRGLAGRFQFEAELGRGGAAVVYLATDLLHDRRVALKVLHLDLSRSVGAERFLREIRLAAGLQHPGILPIYDSGETAGQLWYVMPLAAGGPLRRRLRQEPQLPLDEALRITIEIGQALEHAHRRGVIHRDIKPENLLLDESGRVLLADFGVARTLLGDKVTETGLAVGTPAYMSPEQAGGSTEPDPRTDVYALGCVLYEMLAGEPPFTGSTPQAIIARHLHQPPPDLRILRPTVTPAVQEALEVALAKVPADRYPTAGDFVRALQDARRIQAPRRSWRRRPAMVLAGTLVLLFLGTALVLALGSGLGGPKPAVFNTQERVAVLYFQSDPADTLTRQVATALTEDLIRELSGVNAFEVVSRNGVARYRDRGVTLDSMGSALGATTLVDGTVTRSSDRVLVQVELLDGTSSAFLVKQSISVERPVTDLLSLEQELVRQVASALRRELGREIRVRGSSSGTRSESARSLMLRAIGLRDEAARMALSSHPNDIQSAVIAFARADSLLIRAAEADRDWLRPVVERGWVLLQRAKLLDVGPRVQAVQQALELADQAVLRAPDDAEALELRGTLAWQLVTDFEAAGFDTLRVARARADLQRAVDLDSTRAGAWVTLSFLLDGNGQFAEGAIAARKALRMDAYLEAASQVYHELFFSALMRADFDDARHWCAQGRIDFPGNWGFIQCELTLLRHDTRSANPDSAWALVRLLTRLDSAAASASGRGYHNIYRRVAAASIAARAGLPDSAVRILAEARRITAGDEFLRYDLAYDEAYLLLVLGRRDEAQAVLQQLLRKRPVLQPIIARDPLFQVSPPLLLALPELQREGA